jgi:putative transposase
VRSAFTSVRQTSSRNDPAGIIDQVFFWNAADLARKLNDYKIYYNTHRVHRSLGGSTPALRAGASSAVPVLLDHHAWRPHCRGLFQTPIAA